MVSQLNEKSEGDRDKADSFQKIVELETQITIQKAQQVADAKEFREKIEVLSGKIDELLVLLDTLKTLGKLASYVEKTGVFLFKFSAMAGTMYAIYKFGLTELAEKIRGVK